MFYIVYSANCKRCRVIQVEDLVPGHQDIDWSYQGEYSRTLFTSMWLTSACGWRENQAKEQLDVGPCWSSIWELFVSKLMTIDLNRINEVGWNPPPPHG